MPEEIPDDRSGLTPEEEATVADFAKRSRNLSDDDLTTEAAVVLASARRAAEMGDEGSANRALMGLSILLDEAERRAPGTRLALETRLNFRQHEALQRLAGPEGAQASEGPGAPGDVAEG